MGKYDSTKTRVTPLFNFINSDPIKLNTFFSVFGKIISCEKNSKVKIYYGENEAKIQASKSMLIWMLENPKKLNRPNDHGENDRNSSTFKKRELLFSGDSETLAEAIDSINKMPKDAKIKWYILEGKTSPDIYIETEDAIFIGEAKRTEKKITTKTRWLKNRDQLIRHIDSQLDQPKKIYSFYLLEKKYFEKYYKHSMQKYYDEDYFKSNLEHRNDELIDRAFNSFIGIAFWEDLSELFKLDFPDTVTTVR